MQDSGKMKSLLEEIKAKVDEAIMACGEEEASEPDDSVPTGTSEGYGGDKSMKIKAAAAAIRKGMSQV